MATFFIICAGVGVGLLGLQLVLGMFGVGEHHGLESAGSHWEGHDGLFYGVLSLRAISAAVGTFGMGGMAALSAGLSGAWALALGALVGGGSMALVATLMRSMRRLGHSGTVDLQQAVDRIATVYVAIPGNRAGQGKVMLDVMNRTHELCAVTQGPALASGSKVRVVQLVDEQTAEVVSAGF